MRRRMRTGLVTVIGVVAVTVCTTPAVAQPALFREYVALGDSWSAASTLMPPYVSTKHVPFGCGQATYNYPKQVAAALRVEKFRDATCGSATTASMARPQTGLPFGGSNPAQFARLTRTTDLVTLGVGGNDSGITGALVDCLNWWLPPIGSSCRPRWVTTDANGKTVDRVTRGIRQTAPKLGNVIDGIRARAPRAKIVLVDYLAGLPEAGCWPYVVIYDSDMRWLRAKLVELNAMIRGVARAKGVGFVDTFTGSIGHDACQWPGTMWVEGWVPLSSDPLGLAVPFHPNRLGANHQARTVLRALTP